MHYTDPPIATMSILSVLQSALLHAFVATFTLVSLPFFLDPPSELLPTLTVDLVDVAPSTNLLEGLPGTTPLDATLGKTLETNEPVAAAAAPSPAPRRGESDEEAEPISEDALALTEASEQLEARPEFGIDTNRDGNGTANVPPPPEKPEHLINRRNRERVLVDLGQQLQNIIGTERQRQVELDEQEQLDDEIEKARQRIRQQTDETERDQVGQAINTDFVSGERLGADVATFLRSHLSNCWHPPATVKGADSLVVDVRVIVNQNRNVEGVVIKDQIRYNTDFAFRRAADAVERAVRECSPLPLPANEYDNWRELNFRFDPRFL
ncbi:MAG: TonB C-terminal domain-containing protein [Proteobacteria bacterium]|nr:TonB C-terminal domain-containing protein [Pseudomonadota bacterium]